MCPARAQLLGLWGFSLATDGAKVFGGSKIFIFFDEEV
jgi:hypothetical protein